MIKTEQGYARLFKIYGKSETEVKERIQTVKEAESLAVISTRRRNKEIHVLAEVPERDPETAKAASRPVSQKLKKALGDLYYSTREEETLEDVVVKLLIKNEMTVSTAESCTGGMVAARLVNVPGVSEVFKEGYITYSNKAKRKLLGVEKATLKEHGAVSRETAEEMARGGMEAAGSDACVAITGIAGPDGGSEEKPVGLVYIGCCVRGDVTVEQWNFRGSRKEIREQSASAALDLLRRSILAAAQ